MTATPSSEARAEAERLYEYEREQDAFVAGAEWKGAQNAEALMEMRDALRDALGVIADFVPEGTKPYRNGWIAEWSALSGVESSDEPAHE